MQYFTKIVDVKENEKGTYVILHVPGHKIGSELNRFKNSAAIDSELLIDDKRRITSDQLKKIWATINDIAEYHGWLSSEDLKDILVENFCHERNIEVFSLSRRNDNAASVTIAREFITYLIDFCIEWEIPLIDLAVNRTEDIDKYIYKCLAERICCITGRPGAQIHHVEGSRVGMGRDRRSINHLGLELIPLSPEWHSRVHIEGEYFIFKKYKIYGLKADEELLEKLKINYEEIS